MTESEWFEQLFNRLSHSKFRSRFHLKQKDKEYMQTKGMDTIEKHAIDFVEKRLAPAYIPNDGKQTPFKGHPVFIAQHATGCCCRQCLYKWHKIKPNQPLGPRQKAYIVKVLMTWIHKEVDLMNNHMDIPWHEYTNKDSKVKIENASLTEKSSVIGRIGLMLLACGTGAWRVRSSMNTIASELNITCIADIGLTNISYTCIDGIKSHAQSLSLHNTSVNTSKLARMEDFVYHFKDECKTCTCNEIHNQLDQIESIHSSYSPIILGLAAALACSCFTFLLGGGPIEMLCAFVGAGLGNTLRMKLIKHNYTLFLNVAASVSLACLAYALLFNFLETCFGIATQHEAGYICSMLFIIPGFPFITSGIDLAKLDLRSGLERLAYAIIIILAATLTAWICALVLHLQPVDFVKLHISTSTKLLLRLLTSFGGVFGFSIMFNSSKKIAASAGCIGAIANTLRLTLVDLSIPAAAAAFIGALTAGLLASMIKGNTGYPRIAITVPSIVIMVPGLYMYRAIYNLELTSTMSIGANWLIQSLLIVLALPMGLIFARILTDPSFRYCT